MSNAIRIVGGPRDGQTYPFTSARWLCVPDAREQQRFVDDDGMLFRIYGKHTYDLRIEHVARATDMADKRYDLVYSWVWVSYQSPDGTVFTDWPVVEKRLENATLEFFR